MTRALVLGALLVALSAGSAAAHGFHLELRAEGASVHGEAYFGDGTPPGEASWTAFRRGEETPLASGKTDAQGHFDWRAPAPGTYRCVVKEVGLHVASAEVVVEGPPAGAGGTPPSATPSASPEPGEAGRRPRGGRGNRGRVKRLLTGLGGIALLGVGLYRFQRRRREREESAADEGADEGADEPGKPSPGDA